MRKLLVLLFFICVSTLSTWAGSGTVEILGDDTVRDLATYASSVSLTLNASNEPDPGNEETNGSTTYSWELSGDISLAPGSSTTDSSITVVPSGESPNIYEGTAICTVTQTFIDEDGNSNDVDYSADKPVKFVLYELDSEINGPDEISIGNLTGETYTCTVWPMDDPSDMNYTLDWTAENEYIESPTSPALYSAIYVAKKLNESDPENTTDKVVCTLTINGHEQKVTKDVKVTAFTMLLKYKFGNMPDYKEVPVSDTLQLYVPKDADVEFKVELQESGCSWATNYPKWSDGSTGEEATYTFSSDSTLTVTGGVSTESGAVIEKELSASIKILKIDHIEYSVANGSNHVIDEDETVYVPKEKEVKYIVKSNMSNSQWPDDTEFEWTSDTNITAVEGSEYEAVSTYENYSSTIEDTIESKVSITLAGLDVDEKESETLVIDIYSVSYRNDSEEENTFTQLQTDADDESRDFPSFKVGYNSDVRVNILSTLNNHVWPSEIDRKWSSFTPQNTVNIANGEYDFKYNSYSSSETSYKTTEVKAFDYDYYDLHNYKVLVLGIKKVYYKIGEDGEEHLIDDAKGGESDCEPIKIFIPKDHPIYIRAASGFSSSEWTTDDTPEWENMTVDNKIKGTAKHTYTAYSQQLDSEEVITINLDELEETTTCKIRPVVIGIGDLSYTRPNYLRDGSDNPNPQDFDFIDFDDGDDIYIPLADHIFRFKSTLANETWPSECDLDFETIAPFNTSLIGNPFSRDSEQGLYWIEYGAYSAFSADNWMVFVNVSDFPSDCAKHFSGNVVGITNVEHKAANSDNYSVPVDYANHSWFNPNTELLINTAHPNVDYLVTSGTEDGTWSFGPRPKLISKGVGDINGKNEFSKTVNQDKTVSAKFDSAPDNFVDYDIVTAQLTDVPFSEPVFRHRVLPMTFYENMKVLYAQAISIHHSNPDRDLPNDPGNDINADSQDVVNVAINMNTSFVLHTKPALTAWAGAHIEFPTGEIHDTAITWLNWALANVNWELSTSVNFDPDCDITNLLEARDLYANARIPQATGNHMAIRASSPTGFFDTVRTNLVCTSVGAVEVTYAGHSGAPISVSVYDPTTGAQPTTGNRTGSNATGLMPLLVPANIDITMKPIERPVGNNLFAKYSGIKDNWPYAGLNWNRGRLVGTDPAFTQTINLAEAPEEVIVQCGRDERSVFFMAVELESSSVWTTQASNLQRTLLAMETQQAVAALNAIGLTGTLEEMIQEVIGGENSDELKEALYATKLINVFFVGDVVCFKAIPNYGDNENHLEDEWPADFPKFSTSPSTLAEKYPDKDAVYSGSSRYYKLLEAGEFTRTFSCGNSRSNTIVIQE